MEGNKGGKEIGRGGEKGRDVTRWEPGHVTPIVMLCQHTSFRYVAPIICPAKLPFWGGGGGGGGFAYINRK